MNTESLRIFTPDAGSFEWAVEYRGWVETPIHPNYAEGVGQTEVLCVDTVGSGFPGLAAAVSFAREWAEGSGFKIGPPKFSYSNVIEFKLRRP